MTNEVAATAATVSSQVCGVLSKDLARGQDLWNTVITWCAEEGCDFVAGLVVSCVILVGGWLAIRLIAAAVRKALARGIKSNALLTNFVISVITKTLWAFLLVTVLGRLGVNVGPLIAGLGVTGFILGFAFQESLGNLASGLMIAVNAPFKVGDYVIVAGHEGSVLEVNMMATVLATADNKKVVVPNKSAWGSPIINFSAMSTRRVDLKVGIAYGSDVGKAVEIARTALKKVPGVLVEPAPVVAVASLDDSAVTLNVRPWAKSGDYWSVYDAACRAVLDGLEKGGITIPFPQLDVHVVEKLKS